MPSDAQLDHVIIYTDGAAEPNPGPGGYGVVLIAGKHRKELSGGFARTTNNRMELLAVIVGLEALTRACRVTIYSDSKYVVDSIERGSVRKWHSQGWMRSSKERAKNADLWQRFLQASEKHQVVMKWVKGHAGIPENERCDQLAVEAAKAGYEPDEGYFAELAKQEKEDATRGGVFERNADEERSDESSPTETDGNDSNRCKKCGGKLFRKTTKPKPHKPGQTYYYEWVLMCGGCNTMFLDEAAKRMIS